MFNLFNTFAAIIIHQREKLMKNAPITSNRDSDDLNILVEDQKRQLEDVLSFISEVVWVRNAGDNVLTYINNASERVYGLSPRDLIGTSGVIFENVHPDDKQKLQQQIEHTLKDGTGCVEYRIFKDGDLRYISGEGYVKRDDKGNPQFIGGISRDVTELRTTEKKLRDKIDEAENILESITDNFVALDSDFNFTFANRAALSLYGRRTEDLVGKLIWDVFPYARNLKFYSELHRALNQRIPVRFEEFSPSVGKWVLVNCYPTKTGLAIYFRDITAERDLQEALRNSEYNLRALINNTADFIWSVDKDLKIIQINQPFVDFIYSFTNKVLRPGDSMMMDDFGPAMREKWGSYFQRALSGQTFLVIDEELINNTKHNREKRFKPIFSNTGEPIGVSCYARDISEETRLNAKILNEEKKLRAIINNTEDIIWLVNDHMETISANKAYYDRVAGMTQSKNYEELTESDFAEARILLWQGYYSRALNGEAFKIVDEENIDGRTVYDEIRFHPIHDSNNKVVGINCVSRDITAEKEHLIRIQQQNEQLNEIASMQSHQVRGPVASILGLAQLFNTDDINDPSNLTVLEGIKEAAADLDQIIKDVVKKTSAAKL